MKHKALVWVLSVCMVLTMMPLTSFAGEGNVAKIGATEYATLQEAIDDAVNGDTITIIKDITVDKDDATPLSSGGVTVFGVAGKSITIDLNGKSITGNVDNLGSTLNGLISVENNGHLVLNDSSNGNGKVALTAGNADVKALIMACETDSTITINDGTYTLDKSREGYGMIYSAKAQGIIKIKGGNFALGNVGTLKNGSPWVLNVSGQNGGNYIYVTGGTFNDDINHQHYAFEVEVPREKALKANGDGTYTVVDAAAYVDEWKYSGGWWNRQVGYATIAEAEKAQEKYAPAAAEAKASGDERAKNAVCEVHPLVFVASVGGTEYHSLQDAIDNAADGETVKLLIDIELDAEDTDTVTADGLPVLFKVEGKSIKLDMNGKKIAADFTNADKLYYAAIYVADGASLEVDGNGTIDITGVEEVNDAKHGKIHSLCYVFWKRGTTGTLTINNGTYNANDLEDSVIYTNGNRSVTVNNGNFTLDATGTRDNGHPWIFNTKGQNERKIVVKGGTYNADVSNQFWKYEVEIPEGLVCRDNGDGTWTVLDPSAPTDPTGPADPEDPNEETAPEEATDTSDDMNTAVPFAIAGLALAAMAAVVATRRKVN